MAKSDSSLPPTQLPRQNSSSSKIFSLRRSIVLRPRPALRELALGADVDCSRSNNARLRLRTLVGYRRNRLDGPDLTPHATFDARRLGAEHRRGSRIGDRSVERIANSEWRTANGEARTANSSLPSSSLLRPHRHRAARASELPMPSWPAPPPQCRRLRRPAPRTTARHGRSGSCGPVGASL